MSRITLALWLVVALAGWPGDGTLELLPPGSRHDGSVPAPHEVFGFELGDWHLLPEQIVQYAGLLAESERVSLLSMGTSPERRPLVLLAITSAAHQARLPEIRRRHVEGVLAGRPPAPDQPVIVWLGASIHGNEPSGSNAAPLLAWHLATCVDAEVTALLDQAVVLIDPLQNPDGLSRFATWVNAHRGEVLVKDALHREHREGWPGGRGNHYWFDLNRDWLTLVHPESRARVEQFQRWLPTVLGDFHEMETGSTFFFQPGVTSRQHPLSPAGNLELTAALARFHAEALDAQGALYFTEERFDDFNVGKGSTYPDILGSVGILFEQASSRGQLQENAYGELPFGATIRNQLTAALSTLAGAVALRERLLGHQAATVAAALAGADDGVQGWAVTHAGDPSRLDHFHELLERHGIEVRGLPADVERDGQVFTPGADSLFVPAAQARGRLARAVFERRREFVDQAFYDVSAWTVPLALGLPFAELSAAELPTGADAALRPRVEAPRGRLAEGDLAATRAFAFAWGSLHAARAVVALQDQGLLVMAATRPFTAACTAGEVPFAPGAIVIPLGVQDEPAKEVEALCAAAAAEHGLGVQRVTSGLTPAGIDLGSPNMEVLVAPRVALVVGPGVASTEAGAVWHHLDARLGLGLILVEKADLGRLDLDELTHLILVSGSQDGLAERDVERVREWLEGGGVLVALRGAASWAAGTLGGLKSASTESDAEDRDAKTGAKAEAEAETAPASYADFEDREAETVIAGAILAARVDNSHPLGFGYAAGEVALFRQGTAVLPAGADPFARAAVYADAPLRSGYASADNLARLAGTPAALALRRGRGTLVLLADDPVFRGAFLGSARLLENALLFGALVKRTGPLDGAGSDG